MGLLRVPATNFWVNLNQSMANCQLPTKNHTVIGYLAQGKNVLDANHKMLGSINSDGKGTTTVSVLDAGNNKIGSINFETGVVTDKMVNLIGYEMDTEVMWAAPYFFFFKFQ